MRRTIRRVIVRVVKRRRKILLHLFHQYKKQRYKMIQREERNRRLVY